MPKTPEITISTDSITLMPHVTEAKAKKIIAEAKKALIDGHPANETDRTETSITIQVPSGLGDDSRIIVLTTEKDQIVAVLSYNPETRQFSIMNEDEEEEEDEPSSHANIISAIDKAAATIVNAVSKPRGGGGRKKKQE
jgi:hypothetical protein